MISEVDGEETGTGRRGRGRIYCCSLTSGGEPSEEPDGVIRCKPARSTLSAHGGGPGPQGAGQLVGSRDVPGPGGGGCAPGGRIFQAFGGVAEPTVAAGPLLLSGEQSSGHQPLLEADVSVSAAQRGSVQIHAHVRVPGPDGTRRLGVQTLPLTAGGARLPLLLSSLSGPPQDRFGRQSPRLSVPWSAVCLSRPLRGSLPPGGALQLGGPATCSPPDGAVVCRLRSFVCHAHCGL